MSSESTPASLSKGSLCGSRPHFHIDRESSSITGRFEDAQAYIILRIHTTSPVDMSHESRAASDRHQLLRRAQLEVAVLSSNEILSDQGHQDLQEVIREIENEVELLDSDNSPFHAPRESLIEHRAHLVDRVERLRAGFAPQRKLPPEILSQIFGWCGEEKITSLPPDRSRSQVWDLLRVCTKWRRIALTEPSLWNMIEVPERYALSETIVHTLLDIFRNKGSNGVIKFFVSLGCEEDWTTTQRLLLEHPSRLRQLHLKIRTLPNPPIFPDMFHNLMSLTVAGELLENFSPGQIPFMDLSTAHDLRDLSLHCSQETGYRFIPPQIYVPWIQLTSLSISRIPITDAATILSQCTNLVHCSISYIESYELSYFNRITLNSLQTLQLSTSSQIPCRTFDSFIMALVTPALKSIICKGRASMWLLEEFLQFIERSSCTLETFCASAHIIPAHDVVSLLRAMPTLAVLVAYTKDPMSQETLDTIAAEGLGRRLHTVGLKVISLPSGIKFLRSLWNKSAHKNECQAALLVAGHPSPDDIAYCKSVMPDFWSRREYIALFYKDEVKLTNLRLSLFTNKLEYWYAWCLFHPE